MSFIIFRTDIARFLQYFRNLSNSFINIVAILQDFNRIFSKYSLNITVLCGWEHDEIFNKDITLNTPGYIREARTLNTCMYIYIYISIL